MKEEIRKILDIFCKFSVRVFEHKQKGVLRWPQHDIRIKLPRKWLKIHAVGYYNGPIEVRFENKLGFFSYYLGCAGDLKNPIFYYKYTVHIHHPYRNNYYTKDTLEDIYLRFENLCEIWWGDKIMEVRPKIESQIEDLCLEIF